MYYYLILAFQGYCIYHMYKNNNAYYWVFLIIFLPVVGCIIYLITQVYNKRDAEKITSEITNIIHPTKKTKDLEKHLEFADTYLNRINLADAYLELKDYNNALPHYLEALADSTQSDFYVASKLVEVYYLAEDYNKVVFYAEKIKTHPDFKKSKTQFIYGLAEEKLGNFELAETHLKQIDIRYSFYEERLILAKFLLSREKKEEAKAILIAIENEAQNMTKTNKRYYRQTIQEVEKCLQELN